MYRQGSRISAILLFLLTWSLPVQGQVDVSTATLKGTVYDPNEAVVSGATVTVTSPSRGFSKTITTSADGTYQIPLLQPGVFELHVEAQGFDKVIAKGVELTIGQIVVYDIRLKVGSVMNEIAVTAESPLIAVEQTQQANTINKLQVESLPNIGRGYLNYVFTLPGVSSSEAPRAQFPGFTGFGTSGFSIGGSNGRNNLVTIDGAESEYGSGTIRSGLSIEAVQEFQVNRNAFAAEFGFTAGTAVNVVTKSGTNNFHGTAFTFYRNQHTQARNFFDFGAKKAFDQNVYYGGTIGGPIAKDKAFFFTSFEHQKLDQARFRNVLGTPISRGINGNPAQLNYANRLIASGNPVLVGIGNNFKQVLVPLNNAAVARLITDNDGSFTEPDRFNAWVTRVDYQPTPKDTITGRFSLTHNDTVALGTPSNATTLFYRDYGTFAAWNHIFSPAVLNQLRVQIVPNNRADTEAHNPGSPEVTVAGVGTFGQGFGTPYRAHQDRYQFEDSLAWNKGRHAFKFGGSYRPVNYQIENDLWFSGSFNFSGGQALRVLVPAGAARTALDQFNIANGLAAPPLPGSPPGTAPTPLPALIATNLTSLEALSLGLPSTFRQGFGNPTWQDWGHYLSAFAQDSWKVTSRFTLNFGGRVDYDAEPLPLNHNTYFSPRLGFAWDPWGNQKTVIRGGGGIFVSPVYLQVPYLTNLLDDTGRFIRQVAPAGTPVWTFGVQAGKLPFTSLSEADLNSLGIPTAAKAPGRIVFEASPDYRNTYSVQGSLSIARELIRNLSLEVGYQTYRGVHIQLDQETNFRETGVVNPLSGPQYVAINPAIIQKNTYSSIGNSIYHGMTVSLTKRYSNNLQFQANYTFSKAIDDNIDFNSAFAAFRPSRLDLERGISAFNIKHNFVANAVYILPFRAGQTTNFLARALEDVSISPIVFLRSGIPFTIRVPSLTNGTIAHNLYARPWNASRNTGIGANFYSVNMRIAKSFFIRRDSGVKLDFVAEGTNLLNHTNFLSLNDSFPITFPTLLNGPYNLKGDKSLASTTPLGFVQAGDSRQVQFGLRLAF